jgi:hypothetical protein
MQLLFPVYLLFFLASVFSNSRINAILFYVVGVAVMSILNIFVIGGDAQWYRDAYENINSDNMALYIINNDFEFPLFVAIYLEKIIFGIGLPFVLFLIYLSPLLFSSGRSNIALISMFFLVPGSFLLVHNVMRQGVSEVYLLLLLSTVNASGLKFFPLLSHRFGFVMAVAIKAFRLRRAPYVLVALIFGVAVGLVGVLSVGDNSRDAYDDLEFSAFNFTSKLLVCVFPLVIKTCISRFKISHFEVSYVIFFLVILVMFMYVHGRLADRAVFFLIPFTLYSLYSYEKINFVTLKWTKILAFMFILISIGSMFRVSFSAMFSV